MSVLYKQLKSQGIDTAKLPLLHRAVMAAARASNPAQTINALLEGAAWAGDTDAHTAAAAAAAGKGKRAANSEVGSSTGTSNSSSCVQLASGADAAYDAALPELQQVQAEVDQAAAQALATYDSNKLSNAPDMYGSDCSAGFSINANSAAVAAAVQRAFVYDKHQGLICLVVRPPYGDQTLGASHPGSLIHRGQGLGCHGSGWLSSLLMPTHRLVQQEHLSDSEAAAAAADAGYDGAAAAAVNCSSGAGRGQGSRRGSTRGRGRGRGTAATAAAAACSNHDLVLHVQVPELLQLGQRLAQAQQQLEAAATAALNRAAGCFLDSYGLFMTLVNATAELDVLAGLAQAIRSDNAPFGCSFARPRFAAAAAAVAAAGTAAASGPGGVVSPVLQLKGLWHPLMRSAAAGGGAGGASVVPNDLQLGGDLPGAMLLTGGCTAQPALQKGKRGS